MKKRLTLCLGALLFAVACMLPAGAKPLAAYKLLGNDKKGDGQFVIATGASYPACGTGFSCDKYDIISLEMGADADAVHVKLTPFAGYFGTSGVMYAVHFQAGGKKFFTCWNMHSAGLTTDSHDVQENAMGCERFADETRVGPATRTDGVFADPNDFYVDWAVPKKAIGGGEQLTNVVAEIWARGASTSSPGAAPPAPYLWNVGDRAPDTGTWKYP
jgi:hypothetical protein